MKKVISRKNLPSSIGITKKLFWLFFMDYYKAPTWVFASVVTLMVIDLLLSIYGRIVNEEVNIFEDDNN